MFVQGNVVLLGMDGWSTHFLSLLFGVKDPFEVFSITPSSFSLSTTEGIGPPTFFTSLSS